MFLTIDLPHAIKLSEIVVEELKQNKRNPNNLLFIAMLSGSLRIEAVDNSHIIFFLSNSDRLAFNVDIAQSLMRTLCASVAHYLNNIIMPSTLLSSKYIADDITDKNCLHNYSPPSPFAEGEERWELYMAALETAQQKFLNNHAAELNVYGFNTEINLKSPDGAEVIMHIEVANGYPVGVQPYLLIEVK